MTYFKKLLAKSTISYDTKSVEHVTFCVGISVIHSSKLILMLNWLLAGSQNIQPVHCV